MRAIRSSPLWRVTENTPTGPSLTTFQEIRSFREEIWKSSVFLIVMPENFATSDHSVFSGGAEVGSLLIASSRSRS